jgi:hypothetical protein
MGAMGGMKDEQLAAGWKAAEDRGDFDKADEYEGEFWRRVRQRDEWDFNTELARWNKLVETPN